MVSVSLFFQIIIQFWQIIVVRIIPNASGSDFGIIFVVLMVAQSVASAIAPKAAAKTNVVITGCAVGLVFATSALALLPQNNALITVGELAGILFVARLWMVLGSVQLHIIFPEALRATCDSAVSTLVRLLLVCVMPLSGYCLDKFGPLSLSVLAWMVAILYISIMHRYRARMVMVEDRIV